MPDNRHATVTLESSRTGWNRHSVTVVTVVTVLSFLLWDA